MTMQLFTFTVVLAQYFMYSIPSFLRNKSVVFAGIHFIVMRMDNDPTALEQIKEKEYCKKYLLDKRDIYVVGVNFDSVKGNLVGWEEEKIEK